MWWLDSYTPQPTDQIEEVQDCHDLNLDVPLREEVKEELSVLQKDCEAINENQKKLLIKTFQESVIFRNGVSEEVVLSDVTVMRMNLWNKLQEIWITLSEPTENPESIWDLDDDFARELFEYFRDKWLIIVDSIEPQWNNFVIYQNIHSIESTQQISLWDFFSKWKNKFSKTAWKNQMTSTIFLSEGLWNIDEVAFWFIEDWVRGMYMKGNALIFTQDLTEQSNTRANELWHVLFDQALWFSTEDYDKTFTYNNSVFTIWEYAEAFSDIADMVFWKNSDQAIWRITESQRMWYSLSRKVLYENRGNNRQDFIQAFQDAVFKDIYPLAKQAQKNQTIEEKTDFSEKEDWEIQAYFQKLRQAKNTEKRKIKRERLNERRNKSIEDFGINKVKLEKLLTELKWENHWITVQYWEGAGQFKIWDWFTNEFYILDEEGIRKWLAESTF